MRVTILIFCAFGFLFLLSCGEIIKNPYTHNENGDYFYYEKYEFMVEGRSDTITLYDVEEDLNGYRSLKDSSFIWKKKVVWEKPGKKVFKVK